MKLIEDFGQSDELNTFIYQLRKRFSTYYEVVLKLGRIVSRNYFAYEDAAKKYYDKLKEEANEDKDYYDGADISLNKITLTEDTDELEAVMIDNSTDDYSDEEIDQQLFKHDK